MQQAIDRSATFPLSRSVESVRHVALNGARARRVDQIPDGRTCVLVRVLDGGRRGDLTVFGPRTHAILKDASNFDDAIMLQLKPGWATPLLGVPAHELTDGWALLHDLWGGASHDLLGELLDAKSIPAMLDRVACAFAARLARASEPASAPLARRAARLLETEDIRVESVAERLGVTARHLRRAFAENIGLAPKEFARAVRLQRALRLAQTSTDWTRIAAEAGYYDQAHLIGDFRALVGLTPSAFAKRAAP